MSLTGSEPVFTRILPCLLYASNISSLQNWRATTRELLWPIRRGNIFNMVPSACQPLHATDDQTRSVVRRGRSGHLCGHTYERAAEETSAQEGPTAAGQHQIRTCPALVSLATTAQEEVHLSNDRSHIPTHPNKCIILRDIPIIKFILHNQQMYNVFFVMWHQTEFKGVVLFFHLPHLTSLAERQSRNPPISPLFLDSSQEVRGITSPSDPDLTEI